MNSAAAEVVADDPVPNYSQLVDPANFGTEGFFGKVSDYRKNRAPSDPELPSDEALARAAWEYSLKLGRPNVAALETLRRSRRSFNFDKPCSPHERPSDFDCGYWLATQYAKTARAEHAREERWRLVAAVVLTALAAILLIATR
ncbi:MAG: hypothetical protein EBR82_15450 [Caulobacteraceae bacterium]|nr:hypothetical protein [Caulobacteraceae bacterium]